MRRRRGGFALISAVLIGIVLLLIGIAMATYVQIGGNVFSRQVQKDQVLNVADAGLEWAASRFDSAAPSAVATSSAFGGGEYEIAAPSLVPSGNYVIRVDAYLPSKAVARYHRAIQAIIQSASPPAFNCAIAAGGNATLNGHVTITSSPDPHHGDVYANGNLVSNGNVTVDGNTSAHGTDTYGGNSNAPAIALPTLDAVKIDSYYQQAHALASHTFGSFDGTNLSGYYAPATTWPPETASHSNFSINGNINLPLNQIVFIDGDLNVNGNCTITGGGTIVVNGRIVINGNAKLSQGSELSIVSLAADPQAIIINGNANIGGPSGTSSSPAPAAPSIVLFAPNGGATINGNASIYGSLVVGGAALVNGNATITRMSARTDGVAGLASWKVINWRELSP